MVVSVIGLYICIHLLGIVDSSYENYIILPENSEVCRADRAYRSFYLSRQMSFSTGVYNASWNSLLYACKVRIHPNGRLLQYTYPEGHTTYWFHRLLVNISFTSCDDYLTIEFLPEDTTQPMLDPESVNVTCQSSLPQIFDSKHRIVAFIWHTAEAVSADDQLSSSLDIQLSAYMRFEGKFSVFDKQRRCLSGSGFWCGNDTAVCIYGQMRCDQADGCFDGGSDEVGCPPPRNYSHLSVDPRRSHSTWLSYLPWTALGLIPLMLLFVLGLICSPRRSLDDADDLEDDANFVSDRVANTKSGKNSSPPDSPGYSSTTCSSNSSSSSSPCANRHCGGSCQSLVTFTGPPASEDADEGGAVKFLRSTSQLEVGSSPASPLLLPKPLGDDGVGHRCRKSSTARVVTFQLPPKEVTQTDEKSYVHHPLEARSPSLEATAPIVLQSGCLEDDRAAGPPPYELAIDRHPGSRRRQIGFILPPYLEGAVNRQLSGSCKPADKIGCTHHPLEMETPTASRLGDQQRDAQTTGLLTRTSQLVAQQQQQQHQHRPPGHSKADDDTRLPSDHLVFASHLQFDSSVHQLGFALPAHFEAAAIRLTDRAVPADTGNHKFARNSVSQSEMTSAHGHSKKRPAASSYGPEKTVDEDQVTLLTSADTLESVSSTSSESFREDVAPFRRPDVQPSSGQKANSLENDSQSCPEGTVATPTAKPLTTADPHSKVTGQPQSRATGSWGYPVNLVTPAHRTVVATATLNNTTAANTTRTQTTATVVVVLEGNQGTPTLL